jgi:hypothetical protein
MTAADAGDLVRWTTAVFVCVEPEASAAKALPRATIAAIENCVARRSRRTAPSRANAAGRRGSGACAMGAGSQRHMRRK